MPYFQRPASGIASGIASGLSEGSAPASAAGIVQQATSILDRETASGAPVASPVATQSPFLPQGDQIEARADQLRRQASDLIEGVLSLILSAGYPGGRGLGFESGPDAAMPVAMQSIQSVAAEPPLRQAPLLTAPAPVKAGETAKVPFTVTNAGQNPVDLLFYSSDLVGDSGWGIPARKVAFSPRSQSLQPQERATIEALIPIPPQTAPGSYSGVVQAAGFDYLRALMTVPVE